MANVAAIMAFHGQARETVRQTKVHMRETGFVLDALRFNVGDWVMIKQKELPKLQPRYRGPFRISRPASDRYMSYYVLYSNGEEFAHSIHIDDLKGFRPRQGYLARPEDDPFTWGDGTLRRTA